MLTFACSKLIIKNGDIYKGEFLDDKINGRGEYIYLNSPSYTILSLVFNTPYPFFSPYLYSPSYVSPL